MASHHACCANATLTSVAAQLLCDYNNDIAWLLHDYDPDAHLSHSCHAAAQTQSLLMFADRALHTVYLHLSTVQCLASS